MVFYGFLPMTKGSIVLKKAKYYIILILMMQSRSFRIMKNIWISSLKEGVYKISPFSIIINTSNALFSRIPNFRAQSIRQQRNLVYKWQDGLPIEKQ